MKRLLALAIMLAVCLNICACGVSSAGDRHEEDGEGALDGLFGQETELREDPNTVETVDVTNAFPSQTEPSVQLAPVTEENISDYHYVLTKVCTFSDIDRLAFSSDFPVVRTTSNGTSYDYLYSYTGELLIQEPCQGYTHFGGGITAMYCKEGDSQSVRLVNVYTGEILFDDSTILYIEQLSDRYYYMIHSAGYGLVYDMQLRKFIHDLIVTDSSSLAVPFVIDSTLFVRTQYGCYDLYMDDGSVRSLEDITITTSGYVQDDGDDLLVFDSQCDLVARIADARPLTDYAFDGVNNYSDRYFRTGEYMAYSVVNLAGEVIVPGPCEDIRVSGDYIIAGSEDTGMAVFLGDGTRLTDYLYSYSSSHDDLPLITLSDPQNSENKFLYVAGKGVLSLEGYTAGSAGYYSGDDYHDCSYLILSTGQSIYLTGSYSMYLPFLVESDQGVVDLIAGQMILPAGYDFVAATGEHLYVHAQGQWTVYTIEIQQ